MSTTPVPSVVLFVANVKRVAAFYAAIASMQPIAGDEDHVVLQIEGFQLVVHRLRGEAEPTHDEQGRVRVRDDSYTKLCLPVSSIDGARAPAAAHGGFIKSASHEWEARGFRACDGHDPEGNVIQVRERAG